MNYKKVTSKHNQHECNMNDRGINKYANRQTNLQSISDPKRCLCLLENRYYLHFLMNENEMQINSCLVVNHVSLGFNNVKLCYDSYKNNNKKE